MVAFLAVIFFSLATTISAAEVGADVALRDLIQKAARGESEARCQLGLLHLEGKGVAKNPEEGLRWLRLAAEQQHVRAQGVLGAMYRDGVGVARDDAEAVLCLKLARRTFIGTDEAGQVYVGVVWKDDVSLFELMQILQELDVNWYDVINLDGGPSTGIAVETGSFVEILDSAGPVPNVIVIQPK